MVRADAPRAKATPSQIPIMFAGMSRLYGHWSWSESQAAAPRAPPDRIEVPNPPTVRAIRDGRIARSAGDGLDDIGRGRGTRRGLRVAGLEGGLPAVPDREGRGHETVEQGMRPLGPSLELRVELARHEPRVVLQLDDLDEPPVGRLPGQQHARRLERLAIAVVDLEAVAVPLVDDLLAVDRGGLRAGCQLGGVQAQAHRPALVLHVA